MKEIRYAGFRIRFIASIFDVIILTIPVAILIYFLNSDAQTIDVSSYQEMIKYSQSGNTKALLEMYKELLSNLLSFSKWDVLSFFLLMIVTVVFWRKFDGATPGKKISKIKVVDAKTLSSITNIQAITRSLGYIPSILFFGIGAFMVVFRKDKQSLHDLLAGTIVIYDED